MNQISLARIVSIVAHPALLLPATVVGVSFGGELPAKSVATVVAAAVATVLAVMVFSYFRVRSGSWDHADASQPQERFELNVFLTLGLLVVAALSWAKSQPTAVTAGVALCAAITLVALLSRSWLKVSLHAAFAAFAALLCWPHRLVVLALLLLSLAVAWSRLVLVRHTRAEVVLGLVLGAAAGFVFQFVAYAYQ